MTTLRLLGTFPSRSDIGGLLKRPGDAALIERGRPRLLVLNCPCGCGEQYPINLDPQAGKAWRLYRRGSKISVFPSVWRDNGCEAHYIIWRNHISVFSHDYADEPDIDLGLSIERVLAEFGADWVSYVAVADKLEEVPWDVLNVCRRLTREARLERGTGDLAGSFRRALRDTSARAAK
jgi:hypothetical protein